MSESKISSQKKNLYKIYFNFIATDGYDNLCKEARDMDKRRPNKNLILNNILSKSTSKLNSPKNILNLPKMCLN